MGGARYGRMLKVVTGFKNIFNFCFCYQFKLALVPTRFNSCAKVHNRLTYVADTCCASVLDGVRIFRSYGERHGGCGRC